MEKLPSGAWVLVAVAVLVLGAVALLSRKPANLNRLSVGKPLSESPMPVLADRMPPFLGISHWWHTPNNEPLTPESLKGRVVLVDFWTYSCINCIRTQPVLRKWWDAYKNNGLVIVGVHTPEFAFEKDVKNVDAAIKDARLEYPIALDPDYATWNAYNNRYWPAEYLFDRQGRLRYTHFGEGNYDESEAAIRALLAEGGEVTASSTGADTTPAFEMIHTPETYFGYKRATAFANENELVENAPATYTQKTPRENEWSIGGRWLIGAESATALDAEDAFRMSVDANAMHLVLGSTTGTKRLRVLVDGRAPNDDELTADAKRQSDGSATVTVNEKRLYRIARFPQGGRHTVALTLLDPGVDFYAATFGE